MQAPVTAALLVVALSGCVGELLAPETVTLRTVACTFLDPAAEVRVVHHVSGPVPGPVLQSATASWVTAVADVVPRRLDAFSWTVEEGPEGPWTRADLASWRAGQEVLDNGLQLHVVWAPELELPSQVLDETASAGFVLVNATAWQRATQAGHDGETVARALLFHGLGHALGVVNRGVPLHEANGPSREQPMHHEPGGVMSEAWHHVATFPTEAEARAYSEPIVADWRHAAEEVCA